MRGQVCSLQLLLGLASAVTLRSESRMSHNLVLLPQIFYSTDLEAQVPVFISSRNRVAQSYPQALGSLFVAYYDSQGYGGGIRPTFTRGWVNIKSKLRQSQIYLTTDGQSASFS
jgi:hypothetical protein